MANEKRVRVNGGYGTIAAALGAGDTTIAFTSTPAFPTIDASSYLPLVLEPHTPNMEIVWLTAYPVGGERALTWASNGDTNGIIYRIGTQPGGGAFANPATAGKIGIAAFSFFAGWDAYKVADRTASSSYSSNTSGTSEYLRWDFGPYRKVRVTDYSVQHRHDSAANALRTWKLQGSNDNATWTDLDNRVADATLTAAGQWAHFTCSSPQATGFRYIRLLQQAADYLVVQEVEFYGGLSDVNDPPAGATGPFGTIVRGREGTAAVAHASGKPWVHGPTVSDVPDSLALPTVGTTYDEEFEPTIPSYKAAVLADTPLHYYRLNEPLGAAGVLDSSGNTGHTATPTAVTFNAPGLLPGDADPAASFNGASSFITLPATADLDSIYNFTVEAVIQSSAAAAGGIIDRDNGGGVRGIQFKMNADGTLQLLVFDRSNGGIFNYITGGTINDGKPHHCAATYDNVTIRVYVDGVQVASVAFANGALGQNGAAMAIGRNQGGVNYFNGTIDEVAIYTTALSAARIAAHAAAVQPLASKWSWVNKGTSTISIARSLGILSVPSAGASDAMRGIFETVPATPWEFTTGPCSMTAPGGGATSIFGLFARSSGGGQMSGVGLQVNSSNTPQLVVVNFASSSAFSSYPVQLPNVIPMAGVYLRVKDDGTNLIFSYSLNGVVFRTVYTVGRAAFLTGGPNQIGLALAAYNGDVIGATDWLRRTA